jgi:hypothetical protein
MWFSELLDFQFLSSHFPQFSAKVPKNMHCLLSSEVLERIVCLFTLPYYKVYKVKKLNLHSIYNVDEIH